MVNGRSFRALSDVQQSGAVEACWAHNPEVRRSKLRSANHPFFRSQRIGALYTPYRSLMDEILKESFRVEKCEDCVFSGCRCQGAELTNLMTSRLNL